MTKLVDPIDIRGQEHEQAQRDDERSKRLQQDADDLRAVMNTAQGRRFVWRQLERAGVFRTSFAGHDAQTNFNEGQRNIGVMLLADIHEHCVEQYTRMLTENRTDARDDSRKRS